MGNFSFLAKMPEYQSFAKACIDAENIYKDSPKSCISGTRAAMECAIKWIYQKDRNLTYTKSQAPSTNLFARMNSPSFQKIVSKRLLKKLHDIRILANEVLHVNRTVSNEEAMMCLEYLFEFIQWLDRRYGSNYIQRQFSRSDVPTNPSMLQKTLKNAGLVAAGVVATVGGIIFLNNKDRY